MNYRVILYSLGIWPVFVVAAIANGVTRDYFYKPIVGDLASHQISTVIFICIILIITYLFLGRLKASYRNIDLIAIGIIWMIITIIFEFSFGHYVAGHSWDKLIADYNVFKGRIWSLVLLTTLTAPYITGRFILRIRSNHDMK